MSSLATNVNVNLNVQMIPSAAEGQEEELSGPGVLLDADDKTMVSGTYHPGMGEGISQDSCRLKPAQMRSIEDDLLGRLEQALDPRIQNGGGLLPTHGGSGGGGEDQGKDLDRANTDTDMDKDINIDKSLDMNLDMDHRGGTAGGKAAPEPLRRKVARRSQTRSTTQPSQQQSVIDPTLSARSFGH